MSWSPEHKVRTRARIREVASRLFRRDGYAATGVDALMGEAGLTRGGFYAHFRDKAALLEEALHDAFAASEANLFDRRMAPLTGDAWVEAAAARYLTLVHRDRPEDGCPVPSLSAEVARGPRSARETFAARVKRITERMAERMGGDPDAQRRAVGMLATMVGGVLIARAMPEPEDAEAVLAAAREQAVCVGRAP